MAEGAAGPLPAGSVDFHVHVFTRSQYTTDVSQEMVGRANPELAAASWGGSSEEVVPWQQLEAALDAAGIAYAVLLPQETAGVGIHVPTSYVRDYSRQSPRLIPFASLDPTTHPDPAGAIDDWAADGLRGLKLYPSYQFFYPNDHRAYPVYERCAALGWPVVFHTGSSIFPGSRMKYALPIHLDDVAVDFPTLRIVLAHAGRPAWADEAVTLARIHEHVYLDISGLPPHNLLRYLPDLPRLAHKALFGSDWPSTPPIAQTVEGILRLGLSDAQIERIFRGTATALLGLDADG